MSDILAIVTQFTRPVFNVASIVEALQSQTVACDIVVVDNAPRFDYSANSLRLDFGNGEKRGGEFFDYWRFTENAGPPCRFAPALMDHSHEFAFFIDDDLVPGSRCIENLLMNYEWVDGKCATIGEIGRNHTLSGEYVKRNLKRYDSPRRVDMTARGHFVRIEHMRHVLNAKWELIDKFGEYAKRLVSVHDDLLLCCGIQMATNWPTYLTAKNDDSKSRIRLHDLPDGGGGVSSKPSFVDDRNRLIQMFQSIGWESLV